MPEGARGLPGAGPVLLVALIGVLLAACRPTAQAPPTATVATPTPILWDATPTAGPDISPGPQAEATPMWPWEDEVMALTVVYDNNLSDASGAVGARLQTGWGFAAWLEWGDRTLLFDTGADGPALLENLSTLGLDPAAAEIVVLSHDHADHTGGLACLLSVNPQVTVYLLEAFSAKLKAQVRAAGATLVEVSSPLEILPGLWSTGQMGVGTPEQALVARTDRGLVVLTGCAHPGVVQMVARAAEIGGDPIALVVGGLHLGGTSVGGIEQIVAELRRLGVQEVAACHCSGDPARQVFDRLYGANAHACGVGWHWQGTALSWKRAGHGIPAQIGIAAVAVAPSDPLVLYLAAYEPGGLYRSDDGGASWQAACGGIDSLTPLALVVHPADPQRAWVGTGSGGYHTTDGGQTWQPMAELPPQPLYALAVSPDGRTLYAGGETPGIWHSLDGGLAWSPAGPTGPQAATLSLAVSSDGSLFAGTAGEGTWVSRDGGQTWVSPAELAGTYVPVLSVRPDGQVYALASGRLYHSSDHGDLWEQIGPSGWDALSLAVALDGRLFLGSKGAGLAVSTDGGASWALDPGPFRHADITCLAADPINPGRVYLGTRHNGLYRTDDGGASWVLISAAVGRPLVTALARDPADPRVLHAGTLDGVYRSDDGGERWRLVSGELGKVFVQGLALSPATGRIYAGTRSGIYVSDDGGASWHGAEQDTAGIAVFDIVVDPHDAMQVYAGTWGHNVLRSMDGGRTWAPIHRGLETLSVYAFAVDPSDPQTLYAGTVEAIYRSTDGGETWLATPLSDRPLTTFALVVDPAQPSRLFAGTTEGVYLSVDRGRTWQPAGHGSLSATVTALAPCPTQASALLAGTEGHGLYRSTDGGAHWQPWGLQGASVYAILTDPAGTVWLGTNFGPVKSR